MRRLIFIATLLLTMTATIAMADSIDNRLGLTGRVGAIVPLATSEIQGKPFWFSDSGLAAGGGLIYGFGKYFAAEIDISQVPALDVIMESGKVAEANFTDISLGIQYRIMPNNRFVPYIGVGGDFIKGYIENTVLEWTFGGHANVGLDFFINKGIALNLDCKGVVARKSDITENGVKVGSFDPASVITTLGVRLILPEKWW